MTDVNITLSIVVGDLSAALSDVRPVRKESQAAGWDELRIVVRPEDIGRIGPIRLREFLSTF